MNVQDKALLLNGIRTIFVIHMIYNIHIGQVERVTLKHLVFENHVRIIIHLE